MLSVLIAVLLVGILYYAFKPQTSTKSVSQEKSLETAEPTKPERVMTTNKKIFRLVVKEKKLFSGSETLSVTQGDEITIHITADEADELHVHGYDKSVDIEKDIPAELSFIADKTGRFPFELEIAHSELGALEVQPK